MKECYYYLDSTPTHSYMKALYKYPQNEYPYSWLVDENRRRSRQDPEFELCDTGKGTLLHYSVKSEFFLTKPAFLHSPKITVLRIKPFFDAFKHLGLEIPSIPLGISKRLKDVHWYFPSTPSSMWLNSFFTGKESQPFRKIITTSIFLLQLDVAQVNATSSASMYNYTLSCLIFAYYNRRKL